MAEWTRVAVQTVNPGEAIVFTENPVRCDLGLILHRDGSGSFLARGAQVRPLCACSCKKSNTVNYNVSFGANVAIPTGQTVGPITVVIAVDGTTIGGTEMEVTPAAVETYSNISRDTSIPIWRGCCQTISVRNTSAVPILVENASIKITQ